MVPFFVTDPPARSTSKASGPGWGIAWTPDWARGSLLSARYDFSELIDRHGGELLQDHQLFLGAQRGISLGRAQALTFGLTSSAGITHPATSQRVQLNLMAAYHVQLARAFDADLSYRVGGSFYSQADRDDLNQFLNLSLSYRLRSFAVLSAFCSAGKNLSSAEVFDYEVLTAGLGLSLTVRF